MDKVIKVAELFAGVGGFRIGLEGWEGNSSTSRYTEKIHTNYKVVWSNQWEPSTKSQDASKIYEHRFGAEGHSNTDISKVRVSDIPDHDLLVGGFPCQDYSVARTLSQSGGLTGKKGVLWWEIHRILKEKINLGKPVQYLFLENVDRLLKSPAKQRGRDFAIILASLSDLGYAVEWRVINAAEYGFPQRRRRVFILGYYKTTEIYSDLSNQPLKGDWICKNGVFAKSFPILSEGVIDIQKLIKGDLVEISENFNKNKTNDNQFENAGVMINRVFTTRKIKPNFDGEKATLGSILQPENTVKEEFYLDNAFIDRWHYLKGAKNEERINKTTGFKYSYNEGKMIFPDPLQEPSRTIITGEGGASPSRFKHVIKTPTNRLRRLTPIELERLNMFPDNHTNGASNIKRAFFMGNALVVGIVEKVGQQLMSLIKKYEGASV